MSSPLSLLCYVRGDDANRVFEVEIDKTCKIATLKDAIKEKKKHAFNHIDADTLELWQVSLTNSEGLEEDVEVELSKGRKPLQSSRKLSQIFKSDPGEETISIVIECPQNSPDISLLCYVQGDNSTFPVKVGRQASVGDLKDAIKEKKKHAFNHIDANTLELWQVSIPDSDDLKEDVEEELSNARNPLRSGRNLSDLFKRDPKKGTISIVIERPEISLLCYVQGDNSTFLVTVGRQASVGDLKKAIKEEKKHAFNHIDANTLKLCQVSLPVSEVLEEAVDAFDGDKVALTLATTTVKELFPHEPTKGHVQIIVKPPQAGTQAVTTPSEPLPPTYMEMRRELFQDGPNRAPSTWGKAEEFEKIQRDDHLFFACCRPPKRKHSIPLTLLDPVFGKFLDDCKQSPVGAEDYFAASELQQAMCQFYNKEASRLLAFHEVLEKYGIKLHSRGVGATQFLTDGHLLKGDHPVIILEGKNEISQGTAEPTLQALLYYNALCKSGNVWRDKSSCHPCFAIVLAGPHLGFGGCALSDRPTMEMFSFLPLMFHEFSLEAYAALARHLSALKKAMNTLTTRYEKAPPGDGVKSSINPDLSVLPPHPTEFHPLPDRSSTQPSAVAFSYDKPMEGRALLFSGWYGDDRKAICIKFVRGYGDGVHSWCAGLGFAPKLIAYDQLPGGWYMVVMERLDESWVYLDDESCQREGMRESIHDAVTRLHQEGMVHGDIRRTNVLVKKDGGREFMLLDFDWAGRDGAVKYPPFVNKNPMLMRPADVSDCAPIRSMHDDIMFQKLFA